MLVAPIKTLLPPSDVPPLGKAALTQVGGSAVATVAFSVERSQTPAATSSPFGRYLGERVTVRQVAVALEHGLPEDPVDLLLHQVVAQPEQHRPRARTAPYAAPGDLLSSDLNLLGRCNRSPAHY
jgi:hypothetical protein